MKKKIYFTIIFSTSFILLSNMSCFGKWLILSKPSYKGRVIDTEDKKPIEGAVVVAVYQKYFYGFGAGGGSEVVKVKETLTDKKGEFYISSYSTIIDPFCREDFTRFIIYKPGYNDSYPLGFYNIPDEEGYFYSEKYGMKNEKSLLCFGKLVKTVPITYGEVELIRANTWKERSDETMISIDISKSKWPLLNKMLNEEDKWLKLNKMWRVYDNKSSLLSAARVGDVNMVRTLIEKNIDVNYSSPYGSTALYTAAGQFVISATKEYLEIVKLLLGAGADVNIPNAWGYTPLMIAAKACNKKELLIILLESGADKNLKTRCSGGYCTALDFAKERRCYDIIKILQEN